MKVLMELKERECHYPLVEDRREVGHFFFCAKPNKADSSYCPEHAKLCGTVRTVKVS